MPITIHKIANPAQDVYVDVSMFKLNATEGQLLTCAEGEFYISVYVGTDFTGKSQGVIALLDFIGGAVFLPERLMDKAWPLRRMSKEETITIGN